MYTLTEKKKERVVTIRSLLVLCMDIRKLRNRLFDSDLNDGQA